MRRDDKAPLSEFEVIGPLEIPTDGDLIPKEAVRDFWAAQGNLAEARGCYVFALRTGGGVMPVYVGRATNTFKQECFAAHKLAYHYLPALERNVGTPVMFFVKQISRRNISMVAKLEDFLIQIALEKNPELSNIARTHRETFRIHGVHNSGPGKPSKDALAFRQAMGFKAL